MLKEWQLLPASLCHDEWDTSITDGVLVMSVHHTQLNYYVGPRFSVLPTHLNGRCALPCSSDGLIGAIYHVYAVTLKPHILGLVLYCATGHYNKSLDTPDLINLYC